MLCLIKMHLLRMLMKVYLLQGAVLICQWMSQYGTDPHLLNISDAVYDSTTEDQIYQSMAYLPPCSSSPAPAPSVLPASRKIAAGGRVGCPARPGIGDTEHERTGVLTDLKAGLGCGVPVVPYIIDSSMMSHQTPLARDRAICNHAERCTGRGTANSPRVPTIHCAGAHWQALSIMQHASPCCFWWPL